MKFLEVFRMRSPLLKAKSADKELSDLIEEIRKTPDLSEAKYYVHGHIPGDRIIILAWNKEHSPTLGSELSHRLIQELKKYGVVHYSNWLEKI